ncbi:MAG: hypothetical protein HRT67_12460 [Flavobacteriaceae bacterium]|nr:hypothetical protein [Flavobacteriaceae bacterium]
MKKLITIGILAFLFVLGTQNLAAQNIKNIDVYAKTQSQEVKKLFDLDENATQVVWRAFYVKAKSYAESIDGKDQKSQSVIDVKKRIENIFKNTILMVLDDTQYTKFVKWMDNRK